jgi:ATP-binding cassette subfamily F protein uup
MAAQRAAAPASALPSAPRPAPATKKRLSWKEQRELEGMESAIHDAEAKVEALQAKVNDPQILTDHVKLHEAYAQLGAVQAEVERLYARWAELDAIG